MIENAPIEHDSKFKFRYQKDAHFQALIDAGVGQSLSESGYCWAACIDMALSPSLPEGVRLQLITDAVKHESLAGDGFNSNGALFRHKLKDFVDVINSNLEINKLSPKLTLITERKFEDFHLELQKGRFVIFGVGDQQNGHMMIMDKVYQDGSRYFYSVWDPEIPNLIEANFYLDIFQLYGRQQFVDIDSHPFIISVGGREY